MIPVLQSRWRLEGNRLVYYGLRNAPNTLRRKVTVTPSEARAIAALDGSWTKYENTLPNINAGNQTNYYYTNGQQVIWDIDNLVAGGGYRDDYAVEIQIVCKVTDPDVLLGGESKEFNNVVSLQNSEGTTIGSDSNGVTIEKQTLSKQGTYNPETNGGRYPFKITLNELGEDLVSGPDTITLVDELSDTLILDTTSIRVVNTRTGEKVSDWTASVDGQTLEIVLPDNQPLTVTYEATVNAAPGQTISISKGETEDTAWAVAILIPQESYAAYTAGVQQTWIIAALGLLLVLLALSFFLSRRFVRPITDSLKRFQQAEGPEQGMSSGISELDELAEFLNARARNQRLEQGELPPNIAELFDQFVERKDLLTEAERNILRYYIDGHEIAEIPDLAFISMSTVRKHNRSIYEKLGVASRDELMLYIDLLRRCGRLQELF